MITVLEDFEEGWWKGTYICMYSGFKHLRVVDYITGTHNMSNAADSTEDQSFYCVEVIVFMCCPGRKEDGTTGIFPGFAIF